MLHLVHIGARTRDTQRMCVSESLLTHFGEVLALTALHEDKTRRIRVRHTRCTIVLYFSARCTITPTVAQIVTSAPTRDAHMLCRRQQHAPHSDWCWSHFATFPLHRLQHQSLVPHPSPEAGKHCWRQ